MTGPSGATPAPGGPGLRDASAALLIMFIWGFNFVMAKLGLLELPPILLVAVRFLLVAAILMPFVAFPRENLKQIAALSVTLGAAHFSMMFTGLRYVDGSLAAIVIQLGVPFSALMATFVFRDPPGWRRVFGMVVAFGGVVLIAGEPRFDGNLWPLGLIVAAAFVWAVGNIQVKKMAGVNEMSLIAWMAAMTAPQLFILSFLLEDGQFAAIAEAGWRGWSAIVYQVFAVVLVGYGLWYRLLSRHSINVMVPFTLLVPVFGVASSILFLNENMSLRVFAGGLVTILGVAIIVLRRPQLAEQAPD